MKWSIWAICTCDCKVNTGFHCWDHWLFLCCLYVVLLAPWEGCRGPQDGSQAASWAQSKSPSTHRHPTALETCSLCVCSALRKRMASLSCCISPTPGGWESSGGGRGHCIKKCFIQRSKFCTIGLRLLFCIVCICVCVGFSSPPPPQEALLFFTHTAPPPHPCCYLLCWGGERKCVLDFWRRPNNTKQKK